MDSQTKECIKDSVRRALAALHCSEFQYSCCDESMEFHCPSHETMVIGVSVVPTQSGDDMLVVAYKKMGCSRDFNNFVDKLRHKLNSNTDQNICVMKVGRTGQIGPFTKSSL